MTAYAPLAKGQVATDPVLMEIAETHGATAAQVACAYLLAEGYIVIPSSSNNDRVEQNFGAVKVQLTEGDMAKIRALNEDRRIVDGDWCPKWDV